MKPEDITVGERYAAEQARVPNRPVVVEVVELARGWFVARSNHQAPLFEKDPDGAFAAARVVKSYDRSVTLLPAAPGSDGTCWIDTRLILMPWDAWVAERDAREQASAEADEAAAVMAQDVEVLRRLGIREDRSVGRLVLDDHRGIYLAELRFDMATLDRLVALVIDGAGFEVIGGAVVRERLRVLSESGVVAEAVRRADSLTQ